RYGRQAQCPRPGWPVPSPNPSPERRRMPYRRVGKARDGRAKMGLRTHREAPMDTSKVDRFVSGKWDDDIVPQLVEYIRIPAKSPMFDADWETSGYIEDAVRLMEGWART